MVGLCISIDLVLHLCKLSKQKKEHGIKTLFNKHTKLLKPVITCMLVADHLHTGHSRGSLLCKVWGFLPLRFIIPLPSFPSYAFSLLPTRPFSQHQVHLRSIQKFVKMYHDLRRSTLLSLKTLILKHCI